MERRLLYLLIVMKILCATDFQPRARAATRLACELACLTGGSVELLHVVDPMRGDVIGLVPSAGEIQDEIRREGEASLAAEAHDLERTGVVVTSFLAEGDVDTCVLDRARAAGADLIVLGASGRSALGRYLVGSGGDRTVRRADRPVLIVPPGVETLVAGGSAGRPLRVIVALDGRTAGEGAIAFARALTEKVACQVTFLRLYWPIEEYTRLGLDGQRDFLSPDPDVIADLRRTLAQQVGTLSQASLTSFSIQPVWGDAVPSILECARGHDLLILGAESRRGLARISHPAVASSVAHRAAGIPVVFAPACARPAPAPQVAAISTVLVTTDLSLAGNAAIPFAYATLAGQGGVVELCHVHERSLPVPAYAYESASGQLTAPERGRIEHQLRALIPADAARAGITTHVSVIDGGEAATAILQASERFAVDAIAMGSRGRGGALRSLLGSVSESVARQANRPVFVISIPREETS